METLQKIYKFEWTLKVSGSDVISRDVRIRIYALTYDEAIDLAVSELDDAFRPVFVNFMKENEPTMQAISSRKGFEIKGLSEACYKNLYCSRPKKASVF